MKCIKMSYRGVEFPVNVKSIRASLSKKISTSHIPKGSARAQEICFNPTVISAGGSFTGKDAEKKAHMLLRAFGEEGAEYLFSPLFSPMKMFFSELELNADAENNCINYTFTFVEEVRKKRSRYDFGYTFALSGENLFEVANRCGVSFEQIAEANGSRDMFSVREGDKLWLK